MLQLGIIGLALLLMTDGGVTMNGVPKKVQKNSVEPRLSSPTGSQCRDLDPNEVKNLKPFSWTFVARVKQDDDMYYVCAILISPRLALAELDPVVYAKQVSIDIGGRKQTVKKIFDDRLFELSKEVKLPANTKLPSYPKSQITYKGCTCIHIRTDAAPISVRKSRVKVMPVETCNSPGDKNEFICVQYIDEVPRGPNDPDPSSSQTDQLLCPVMGSSGYVLASDIMLRFGSHKEVDGHISVFRSLNYDRHWIRKKLEDLSTKSTL